MEALARDAVITPKMALRLTPKILYAVDMIAILAEGFGMIDLLVTKLENVERIEAGEAVGIDDTVGLDGLADDRQGAVPFSLMAGL